MTQTPVYDDDTIRIDCKDTHFDEDGNATRTVISYTDLTGRLECQDVEDFAFSECALEGWPIWSSGWTTDGRTFVIETFVGQV